jgi:hypothetical protein
MVKGRTQAHAPCHLGEVARRKPCSAQRRQANQQLVVRDYASCEIDHRLHAEAQPVVLDRSTELVLPIAPELNFAAGLQTGRVNHEAIAATSLSLVHGEIGGRKEVIDVSSVIRQDSQATTRRDCNGYTVSGQYGFRQGDQRGSCLPTRFARIGTAQKHRELIAAEASDEVIRQHLRQQLANLAEYFVACLVAEAVVDLLEIIQVQEQ